MNTSRLLLVASLVCLSLSVCAGKKKNYTNRNSFEIAKQEIEQIFNNDGDATTALKTYEDKEWYKGLKKYLQIRYAEERYKNGFGWN